MERNLSFILHAIILQDGIWVCKQFVLMQDTSNVNATRRPDQLELALFSYKNGGQDSLVLQGWCVCHGPVDAPFLHIHAMDIASATSNS